MKKVEVFSEFKEEFFLSDTLTGAQPTLWAKFALAYTKDSVKIRIKTQVGEKMVVPYAGDNVQVWRGDAVEFFVSPYGDKEKYFELDIAPNGACFHAKVINPDNCTAYTHLLDVAPIKTTVSVENGVWTTEMQVPFSMLLKEGDADKAHTLPWLFNVYRIDAAHDEYQAFSPTGGVKANFHVPSQFAKMEWK